MISIGIVIYLIGYNAATMLLRAKIRRTRKLKLEDEIIVAVTALIWPIGFLHNLIIYVLLL